MQIDREREREREKERERERERGGRRRKLGNVLEILSQSSNFHCD